MNNKIYLIIILLFSISLWIGIVLSEQYVYQLTIPLKISGVPEPLTLANNTPDSVKITLKTDGWRLFRLLINKSNYFIVTARKEEINYTENLSSYIRINRWFDNHIEVVNLFPKTINIKFENKTERLIKVNPVFDLSFKRGFGLASEIKVNPESILVYGPASKIKLLSEIKTIPIKLKNLDRATNVIAPIVISKEYQTVVKNVNVYLDVQRIIKNTISEIPIKIDNLPERVDVVLIPNSLEITLLGGIEYFINNRRDEIKAKIDFNDIISDTLGYLKPEIQIPKHFNLVSTKPNVVKYIIKKY